MKFINSLFFKKKIAHSSEELLSIAFAGQVEYAIKLLSKKESSITNEQVLTLFNDHKIARKESVEIFFFLPIAFVRHLLPDINWPDSYKELIDGKKFIGRKYSTTTSFQIIWEVTAAWFRDSPNNDIILKIAGRSAEFHAINELLLNGGKLKDIKVTETVIIR